MDAKTIQEARDKLRAKFTGSSKIGGKGTVRRKVKTVHKTASMDDKRLQGTLKRLNVNPIPGIEEVNIFKDDNSIIHFASPKVQASLPSNIYVVSGNAETKTMQDMLPTMLSQMGPDALRMLTEQLAKGNFGNLGGAATGAGADDMPELEGNFDEAAEK